MNECDNMKRQEVKQHIDPWIREKKSNLIIPGSSTKKEKRSVIKERLIIT